jgi:DNA-binding NtrC family response regulator
MTILKSETILFADDDTSIRGSIRDLLELEGYSVIEAVDGQDAIDKFKESKELNLAILDMSMPNKTGWEAYNEIHTIDPHLKVFITSGYTEDMLFDTPVGSKELEFLTKPLLFDDLLLKIRQRLDES